MNLWQNRREKHLMLKKLKQIFCKHEFVYYGEDRGKYGRLKVHSVIKECKFCGKFICEVTTELMDA